MTKNVDERLFHEFPEITTREWEQQITKDLKGADYDKKLIWNTLDGIPVKPYYRSEDLDQLPETGNPGEFPFIRGTKTVDNSWLVRQDIKFVNAAETSEKITFLISRGVQSIGLRFDRIPEEKELIVLFEGINFDQIEMNFIGLEAGYILGLLKTHCNKSGLAKDNIKGSLGYDSIGAFALSGKLGKEEEQFDNLAKLIKEGAEFPNLRIIEVRASNFHNAGSTSVQELAYAISIANEYLDQLTDRDLSIQEITKKLGFTFAVGSNYFFELAKFRAARGLWSRVLEAYDKEAALNCSSHIHAETSNWNKTVYDPYVNMLRTTTEAMSSIIGGVDSLTVQPFDSSFREPDDFSERLARGQQILLSSEAYLDKVVDPAAGSYYLENLTNSMIMESWKIFQDTEAEGGFIDSFLDGTIQNAIAEIAQKRDTRIAQKQDIILGTNQYANGDEKQLEQANIEIAHASAIDPTGADTQPLNLYRGAESFEKLRFETEKAEKQPVVFMLTIGNLTMRKARSGFAGNFFGCAGYKVIDSLGFENISEGLKAANELQADIIVLCSSDDEYATLAPELAKSGTNAEIVIAGYPKDIIDELKNAGIKHFIHVRSNVLETLKEFNLLLGIKQ